MGNEISHEKGTADNVGGTGHVGQFHKVLVEPDYATPYTSHRIPAVAQHRGATDDGNEDHIENSPLDKHDNTETPQQTEEHLLKECKALITESANKALARKLSDSHIFRKTDVKNSAIGEKVRNRTQSETCNQTGALDTGLGPAITGNSRGILGDTQCPSQSDNKGARTSGKRHRTIINMFKFSKNKSKIVAEFVPPTCGIQEIEQSEDRGSDSTNISSNGMNTKLHNIHKSDDKNDKHAQHSSELTTDRFTQGQNTVDQRNVDSGHHLLFPEVERLDSLDSGIVVDKAEESQAVAAEYGIVQEKVQKTQHKQDSNTVSPTNMSSGTETITQYSIDSSTNWNFNEGDYTDINDRAIDVDGLPADTTNDIPQRLRDEPEKTETTTVINETSIETKGDISMNSNYDSKLAEIDTVAKPDKKIKKKSWSFQIGGNRKKTRSYVSADSDYVNVGPKKNKSSLWGRFSFRKSTDDVSSVSKHGSFDAIPEMKTKNKLKAIKAKDKLKNKEKSKGIKEETSELGCQRRFASTSDINTPGSRRSIVDDDFGYAQSDAFEGVSLSDLSLEGHEDVYHNPGGSTDADQKPTSRSDDRTGQNDVANVKPKAEYVNTELQTQHQERVATTGVKDIITNTDTHTNMKTHNTELEINLNRESAICQEKPRVLTNINEHTHMVAADVTHATTPAISGVEYAVVVKKEKPTVTGPLPMTTENTSVSDTPGNKAVDGGAEDTHDACHDTKEAGHHSRNAEHVQIAANAGVKSEPECCVEDKVIVDTGLDQMVTSQRIGEKLASSHNIAYSNEIYGDYLMTPQKDCSGVSDDESDAYVQLEQLVEDYTHCDPSIIAGGNTASKPPITTLLSHVTSPGPGSTQSTEDNLHTVRQTRVIVMKEVGIQAPDIYMPLDIDSEFGTTKRNCAYVNRGTQVSDTEFLSNIAPKSPTGNVQTAYF